MDLVQKTVLNNKKNSTFIMSFTEHALKCLHHISDLCHDIEGVDYEEDEASLTVGLKDGRTYLFNIHKGLQQLWMASPISGGRHFQWCSVHHDAGHLYPWVDTRNQEMIVDVFKAEMRSMVCCPFS